MMKNKIKDPLASARLKSFHTDCVEAGVDEVGR
jgi:hypothetical protein